MNSDRPQFPVTPAEQLSRLTDLRKQQEERARADAQQQLDIRRRQEEQERQAEEAQK